MRIGRSAIALLLGALLTAQVSGQAQSKPQIQAGTLGIMFNFKNLLTEVLPYYDGFQSGAGLKYWVDKRLALRGLTGFSFNSYTPPGDTVADTTLLLALGIGAEFHWNMPRTSPYLGAFLGTQINNASGASTMGFYGGAMAGAEIKLFDILSVFGEYQLKLSYDASGLTLTLADAKYPLNGAVFGLIIYL